MLLLPGTSNEAAEVVQQAWLTLKEHTWTIPISRVELKNQTVIAYTGRATTAALFSSLADIEFPYEAAKHALLCFPNPLLPLALIEPLITQLIEPSQFHLHEVQVELKEALRTVLLRGENGERDLN
ncbi:hypothetical protein ACET3X_005694 [Alternaria dauci]|uniref:Uncharacterized protein n=1 Tax=Alternaria dauci TaxID=48095 RepID=A0ABR3UHL1_9PLEO